MAGMLNQSNGNGTAPRIMPASEMSAHQRNRNQTFDATIQQLNLVITQVNALTATVNAQDREIASLKMQQGVTFNSLAEFCGRALRGRFRWMVTGK